MMPYAVMSKIVMPFAVALMYVSLVQAQNEATKYLRPISDTYHIEIATNPTFSIEESIGGKAASPQELANYARLFAVEFRLYPTELVARSYLKRVVLCKELTSWGRPVAGLAGGVCYFDVNANAINPILQRKIIHHEFYHIVDYWDGYRHRDDLWSSFNPKGFRYRDSASELSDRELMPRSSLLTTKYCGFLNHYSTVAVEEDKAEVFANLMVDTEYVARRAAQDAILDAKVRQMKKLMVQFCADMNDDFWRSLRKRRECLRNEIPRDELAKN